MEALPLILGAVIGTLLGLTGAGGSVVSVPLLISVLGMGFADAAGVSLGAVAMSAAVGVLLRLRQRLIHWRLVLVLAAGGILLAPVGQWLARHLPFGLLQASLVMLLLLTAWRLWREAVLRPHSSRIVRANPGDGPVREPACPLSPTGRFEWRWPCIRRVLIGGAFAGLLSGLYGVGGGFVIVPMLVLLAGLPMGQAVASSLAVIMIVAGSTFVFYLSSMPLPAGFPAIATGAMAGMLAGSLMARWLAGPRLQQAFALFMVVLALDLALAPLMN